MKEKDKGLADLVVEKNKLVAEMKVSNSAKTPRFVSVWFETILQRM